MKHTSNTEIILMAATAVFIIVIAAFFFLQKDRKDFLPTELYNHENNSELPDKSKPDTSEASAENLQSEYRQAVSQVLEVYNSESLNYDGASVAYKKTVDNLLQLKVPAKYQDLHLQLVLSFEKMSEAMNKILNGDEASKADLEKARQELDDILQANPWMKN